ncbi:uncharacterized protein LOC114754120 [Neltuma alba]|uniref:uncharacterized protein LOC114754120 n=1 Tax=Neltuma alba TaxID=207710 RepID=UPI0010A4699A|nr:uncharacterized protein LOC114754120 [Prosopis alba]
MACKMPIGMSPYQIIYKKLCHILVELEHQSYWVVNSCNADFEEAGLNKLLQIQELKEMCLDAYHSSDIYKQKTKLIYDANILSKRFKKRDKVLRYQARFKFKKKKFKISWDGPYIVVKVHDFGMTKPKEEATGRIFQYNDHLLKLYEEPTQPSQGQVVPFHSLYFSLFLYF